MRGLAKVQQQCLLAAAAQNIKKIALLLSRMGPNMPPSMLQALLSAFIGLLPAPSTNRGRNQLQKLKSLHQKQTPTKMMGFVSGLGPPEGGLIA